VLPTQQQDNDPIRRPCIAGVAGNALKAGEEVCNLDGQLGLVLPVLSTDFIPSTLSLLQYPSAICNTNFITGTAPVVFKCAPNGHTHTGECANGDGIFGAGCLLPTANNSTSQCLNKSGNVSSLTTSPLCTSIGQKNCVTQLGFPVATAINPGLVYNTQMRDGTAIDNGQTGFIGYPIISLGTTVNLVGTYHRIHQTETVLGGSGGVPLAAGCQFVDADDQIACLLQADPCSIGFASDGAKSFASATNGSVTTPVGAVDSVRIAQVYPTATTVQLLGQAGEYQYARKIYFTSLVGFSNIAASPGDPQALDELLLGQFEATPSDLNNILVTNKFFTLGTQFLGDGANVDPQFCEDFNEQTNCNDSATGAANVNGCVANSAVAGGTAPSGVAPPGGIPAGNAGTVQYAPGATAPFTTGPFETTGSSTVCGDGIRGPYEECDNGSVATPANSHATGNSNSDTSPGGCSLTCRCNNDFVNGNCT
jgi:hypothetical protein